MAGQDTIMVSYETVKLSKSSSICNIIQLFSAEQLNVSDAANDAGWQSLYRGSKIDRDAFMH